MNKKNFTSENDFDEAQLAELQEIPPAAPNYDYHLNYDPLEDFHKFFISIFQENSAPRDLKQ